jgi:hypothetical protein
MWQKDDYQEHMLGYLSWVQTEIERIEQTCIRRNGLDQLYEELEITLDRLWRLISATEVHWERFRYPLELSSNSLLRMLYRVPTANSLILPVRLTITERYESSSQARHLTEMFG